MGHRKTTSLIRGAWRIVQMDQWDAGDLDLIEPACVEFGPDQLGSMVFIALQASIDYRVSQEDGQIKVDFTWEGQDEGDPVSGRGWAVLQDDKLAGKVFIHNGDESAFIAERQS